MLQETNAPNPPTSRLLLYKKNKYRCEIQKPDVEYVEVNILRKRRKHFRNKPESR